MIGRSLPSNLPSDSEINGLSLFFCYKLLAKFCVSNILMGQLFIDVFNHVRSFHDLQETTDIIFESLFRLPLNIYMFIRVINT